MAQGRVILQRPWVTEKTTRMGEKRPRYCFLVAREANRIEIARAVEQYYNVVVESVNTMRYQGKRKSRYTKHGATAGRTYAYKKAVVTLRQGDSIDFYSSI